MKQLVSFDEAEPTYDQHTSPCSDCPFSRSSMPGWVGSMTVQQWVRVAHSDSPTDCHALVGEDGEPWRCAGLAIYRRNVCKRMHDPEEQEFAERCGVDRDHVFTSPLEFQAHHEKKYGTGSA